MRALIQRASNAALCGLLLSLFVLADPIRCLRKRSPTRLWVAHPVTAIDTVTGMVAGTLPVGDNGGRGGPTGCVEYESRGLDETE